MSLVPKLRSSRPRLYVCVVAVVAFVAMLCQLRLASILSCPAGGYESNRFLEYCQAEAYGDYDHGAFLFGLEPEAERFARDADVMFLGNSREQFAFSTDEVDRWFASRTIRHYLLGFSYHDGHRFAREVLRTIKPQAKAYIINMDEFFAPHLSAAAEPLFKNRTESLQHYQTKRSWQSVHKGLCGRVPMLCGQSFAVFRVKDTGRWIRTLGQFQSEPVSNDPVVDEEAVRQETSLGVGFLNNLTARRECVILTHVPTGQSKRARAEAIARSLKLVLISPSLDGLRTFDGSHLDQESAARFSQAFLEAAGPRIQKCVSQPTDFSGILVAPQSN